MFVSIDLHKSYLAVLDGTGKVLKNSRIDNDLRLNDSLIALVNLLVVMM
jgi:hypothetical protein